MPMPVYAIQANGHALPAEIRLVRMDPMPVAPPIEMPSERELEVLTHIAAGIPYHQAAGRLYISERTFRSHASNINAKLATNNIVQAAIYMLALGAITWADIMALWRQHAPHLVDGGS